MIDGEMIAKIQGGFSIAASAAYFAEHDFTHGLYWLAAAILTATVTIMR